jgi:hypothetical protein
MSTSGGIWLHGDQNMDPGRLFVVTAVVSNPRILGSKLFNLIIYLNTKVQSSVKGKVQ